MKFLRAFLLMAILACSIASARASSPKFWYRIEIQTGDKVQVFTCSSTVDTVRLAIAFGGTTLVPLDDYRSATLDFSAGEGGRILLNPRYVIYFTELSGPPN